MRISKTIEMTLSNGQPAKLEFGQPERQEELEAMYRFRNDSYVSRGYIEKGFYADGLDIDEDDRAGRCAYFVARVDDRIIGTVRLIKDEYLPTERDCFDFEEPRAMASVPRSRRAEVGRLIVGRYSQEVFLPRHIVMIGLIDEVVRHCLSSGIEGGYGFIKDKLKKKMEKLSFPVHVITSSRQKYQGRVMHGYFNDPKDRVWPIYYLAKEMKSYLDAVGKAYLQPLGGQAYRLSGDFSRRPPLSLAVKIMFLRLKSWR